METGPRSLALLLGFIAAACPPAAGQALPNPYRAVDGWAKMPPGRSMGAVGDLMFTADGKFLWAIVRCDAAERNRFGDECADSNLDPVIQFDREGRFVRSFGGGLFVWPHGLDVDRSGNVWVTDAVIPTRTPKIGRAHV